MRLIDEAEIYIQAGSGGDGAASFRREKFIPKGGPDGGDGGNGGNIYVRVNPNLSTLVDFHYKKKFITQNGHPGGNTQKTGADGEDIVMELPPGSILYHKEKNYCLYDLKKRDTKPILLCKGGRGGKGNMRFKSASNQAPSFAQKGTPGEFFTLKIELKLLADVAIIGLPNAGKSSFIASVSAARPKIANYPFTTLVPNLGVVSIDYQESFVLADIPGLIPGASQGSGLGFRFLKHIERSKLLLHIVDMASEEDPKVSYEKIRQELGLFHQDLIKKPEIILLNKMDALSSEEKLQSFLQYLEKEEKTKLCISVATGQSIKQAIQMTYGELKKQEKRYKAPSSYAEIQNELLAT